MVPWYTFSVDVLRHIATAAEVCEGRNNVTPSDISVYALLALCCCIEVCAWALCALHCSRACLPADPGLQLHGPAATEFSCYSCWIVLVFFLNISVLKEGSVEFLLN